MPQEPLAQAYFAMGLQSTFGTIDPTIAALSGALALSDGIILGDPDFGVGGSGVEVSFIRAAVERARIAGWTTTLSNLIERRIDNLTIKIRWCGNRNNASSPPVDGDFEHAKGIKALLGCCGITGAAYGSGVGWLYSPASYIGVGGTSLASLILWIGVDDNNDSVAVKIRDLIGTPKWEWIPDEVPTFTATLSGTIDSFAVYGDIPTFDYGVQASVSAPACSNVGFYYGTSPAWAAGFTKLAITVDNKITAVPDSNHAHRFRQSDRIVSIEGTLYSDKANPGQFLSELARSSWTSPAAQKPIQFTVGSAATAGNPCLAHVVSVPYPELTDAKPAQEADLLTYDVKMIARHPTTANSELGIILV